MIYKNYDYFLTIAKLGGLTKAAEALYISQPSLSKYLSRLEANLNIQLFDRTKSPLMLTHAGKLYYDYLYTILEMNDRLQCQFDEIRNDARGELTIGINGWRGSIILPKLLPLFHQRYPNIKLNVAEGKSYSFEAAMLNNQVDFSLMTLPSNFNLETSSEIITREHIYLMGNKNHPLVQKALETPVNEDGMHKFNIADLNGEKFINLKQGQVLYQLIRQFISDNDIQFSQVWSTESCDTCINMVNATDYFSVVPSLCKRMNFFPEQVALFELGDVGLTWDVALVYPKNLYVTHIMRLAMETIKEVCLEDI